MLLFLQKISPSLNVSIRKHWAEKHRNRRSGEWAWLIRAEAGAGPLPCFRKLRIVRVSPRSLDVDNLAGGCKELVDAIKKLGLIKDDRPEDCELSFAQRKPEPGEEPGMEIHLNDQT